MMEYNVRRIKKDELEKLLELYSFLNPDDTRPARADLTEAWEHIFDNEDKFIYLVIEDNGIFVASCNVSIIPKLTRGAKPFAVIENVITHPDYLRRGLGKKIINEALSIAKNNNCGKAMLLSNYKRKEAHLFYENLGFNSDEKKGFVYNL
jgi:GNAT superfamily N-acetyltransferase